MKRKIDVSVIIPIYNSEKYLENCLVSIQDQSLATIEIICVNDGSNDSSQDIIDFFCSSDIRFSCYKIAHIGAGKARNIGLKHAKGDYVCFLDSDDWFQMNMLEDAYKLMKQERLDVCVWGATEFNESSMMERKSRKHFRNDYISSNGAFEGRSFDHIFNFTCGSAWNKMFSREYLESINAFFLNTYIFNDIYFTYVALALAQRIDVLNSEFVHYRVNNPNSLQSKLSDHFDDIIYNLCEIENRLKKEWIFDYVVKRSFKNFEISLFCSLLLDVDCAFPKADCSNFIKYNILNDFFDEDLFDDNVDAYHYLLEYIDNMD